NGVSQQMSEVGCWKMRCQRRRLPKEASKALRQWEPGAVHVSDHAGEGEDVGTPGAQPEEAAGAGAPREARFGRPVRVLRRALEGRPSSDIEVHRKFPRRSGRTDLSAPAGAWSPCDSGWPKRHEIGRGWWLPVKERGST